MPAAIPPEAKAIETAEKAASVPNTDTATGYGATAKSAPPPNTGSERDAGDAGTFSIKNAVAKPIEIAAIAKAHATWPVAIILNAFFVRSPSISIRF